MTRAPGELNLASNADMMQVGGIPHDYFAVLRREAPVFWNPPPVDVMWFIALDEMPVTTRPIGH